MFRPVSRATSLVALSLAVSALWGCSVLNADLRHVATAEWRKTYELQPGGDLTLRNVNGRVVVEPSQGRTVEVVAEKIGKGSSDDEAGRVLDRIEIRESASPSTVRIETVYPRSRFGGGWEVRYTVRVPAGVTADLATVNGGLDVTGVTGDVRLATTNGGIRARDLGGAVEASSTNGGIEIDVTRLAEGGIDADCTNGGITVRLPADAKATVVARTVNGGIDTRGLDLQMGEWSRRRLEARMNGGGPRVSITGVNGGIRLRSLNGQP